MASGSSHLASVFGGLHEVMHQRVKNHTNNSQPSSPQESSHEVNNPMTPSDQKKTSWTATPSPPQRLPEWPLHEHQAPTQEQLQQQQWWMQQQWAQLQWERQQFEQQQREWQ